MFDLHTLRGLALDDLPDHVGRHAARHVRGEKSSGVLTGSSSSSPGARDYVLHREDLLKEGIVALINNYRPLRSLRWKGSRGEEIAWIVESSFWFAKIIRVQQLTAISLILSRDVTDPYMNAFLKIHNGVDVFDPISRLRDFFDIPTDYYWVEQKRAWGSHERIALVAAPSPLPPIEGKGVERLTLVSIMSTYVVPQLVHSHLISGSPLVWDLQGVRLTLPDDNKDIWVMTKRIGRPPR